MKISLDALGEHFDRTSLGEARGAFDQQVTVAQQREQHAIDQVRLADDQAARMLFQLLKSF
jgi:hypothetical protein